MRQRSASSVEMPATDCQQQPISGQSSLSAQFGVADHLQQQTDAAAILLVQQLIAQTQNPSMEIHQPLSNCPQIDHQMHILPSSGQFSASPQSGGPLQQLAASAPQSCPPTLFLTEALRAAAALALGATNRQQENLSTTIGGDGHGEASGQTEKEQKNFDFSPILPPVLTPNQTHHHFNWTGPSFHSAPLSSSSSESAAPMCAIQSPPPNHRQEQSPLATTKPMSTASANRPVRSQRAPMQECITLDDPNELEEFMARGEERCIQDMRSFITQFSLRQTTVAMMTGVSQPYISKLLNGNHRELSLRCRKNIYCWYLNCRRHPSKLAMFVQDPNSRLETTADGELVPQRRERYVFRPALIRILEAYFRESPFPDTVKRIEIANACNAHLQVDKKDNQLMQKEILTPQVVANWFANKRKEMRRKKHRTFEAGNAANRMSQQHQQFHMVNRNGQAGQRHAESSTYGGGSSSSSSSFSPSPPNSATFGHHPMFGGTKLPVPENAHLATLLESIQSLGDHPPPLLAAAAPLFLGGQISTPTQNNGPILSPAFLDLLLQQQQNFFPATSLIMEPTSQQQQVLDLQTAAAAALLQLPLAAPNNANNLANGTGLAAFQAAKLMENMAALAAQNPQLLASLDR